MQAEHVTPLHGSVSHAVHGGPSEDEKDGSGYYSGRMKLWLQYTTAEKAPPASPMTQLPALKAALKVFDDACRGGSGMRASCRSSRLVTQWPWRPNCWPSMPSSASRLVNVIEC